MRPSLNVHWCRHRQAAALFVALAFAWCEANGLAATVAVRLDAEADPSSYFVTYWSEGIAQLSRTYPGTTNQPFWSTNDPSRTYNSSFDFFPNDNAMRFGELTYDDSGLVSGNGVATITGLVLGIEADPLDPAYINGSWLSFTTELGAYSGSVDVVDGAVSAIHLTATYATSGYFGPYLFEGEGTFTVVGDRFQVSATTSNELYQPTYDPAAAWDWTGSILNLAEPPVVENADFNGDGVVDAADYTVWRDDLGATGLTPYTSGDANGDGQVTNDDYQVWRTQYGGSPPTELALETTAVPEPAGLLSVGVFLLVLGRCRATGSVGLRVR